MTLDEFCDHFLASRESGEYDDDFVKNHGADLMKRLSDMQSEDTQWIRDALEDQPRKWFVAVVFTYLPLPVPEDLFLPMIHTAVYEIDPSFNRYFVEPCIRTYGHRCVNEALLEFFEKGTDFEKAGAVNALYWARLGLAFRGNVPAYTREYAIPESVAAYDALVDIWVRRDCLFLKEFVKNQDLHVRRSIIPSLKLDASYYPDELKPLVAEAIHIAQNQEDDYIRHRVKVQLGEERLLKPLPHRKRGSSH
jgi:hypothetical protein